MKVSQRLSPSFILHLEGAAVLIGALLLYGFSAGNWWLFVLLALAPDLSPGALKFSTRPPRSSCSRTPDGRVPSGCAGPTMNVR